MYQGGWQILGTEVGGNGEYWDYNAVIENYPGPELYASWSPHAGDIITATTVFNDDNDQVTVSVTDGGNQFVRTYSNSGYPTLFWAQYIVEDPSTNNQPNRLIGWSGDINQTNIDTTYGWNGGTTEAALSYDLTANFCSYEQWYMTPWEMGQTLDASTTFYSTANTLSTVYLTSY